MRSAARVAVAAAAAAVSAVLAVAAGGAAAAEPPPPPAELFFRQPDIESVALSPSGRWLAMTSGTAGGRTALVVFDLRQWGELKLAARYADADIRRFHWVNDERLVFELIDRSVGGGDQRFGPGLFSVRRDGSELRTLVRLRRQFVTSEPSIGREPLHPDHTLLHVPDDGSDEVIVGELSLSASGDVVGILPKRLNVIDRRSRSLALGSPENAFAWWFDARGEPRLLVTLAKGREAIHRRGADGVWQQIAEHERLRAPYTPRHLDAAGELYVTAPEGPSGIEVLKRFDFERRQPHDEALVRAPGFDFRGGVIAETAGGRALGVRVETDAETTVWFDPAMKALQAQADRDFPGRINRLDCRRCDGADRVVLLRSWSDRDPGQLLVRLPGSDGWRAVGRVRPGVDPRQMALRDFHRIKARDGLELPVWVTTPAGTAGKQPRPAVVLVHGGPWVRGGHWRWEPMSQFLASRGYVVIEPEFRGSTGYGRRHFSAGLKQWGLTMQDDVADALQWAVAQGIADGKRACIAGGSYGGYAALMGLVRHPELYRCGAAWVAVTDPRLMFEWSWISDVGDEARHYGYPRLIGDPVADAARLRDNAPVEQAARIKAPVLLVMGGEDRRVPLLHGTRMRDALREAGNPPEWHVYVDEGHGWLKLENRLDFAQRLERFLAQHLKP